MSGTMEADDLWDGIAAGILAEAGFKDGDMLNVDVQDRVITLTKSTESDLGLFTGDFHEMIDLQEDEAMHIKIEKGMVTLLPMSN